MSAGYSILESFADPMQFPTKLLEKSMNPENYGGTSLHAFVACAHSTFPEEEALKLDATRTNWDPVFKSAIPDRDKRERKEGVWRFTSTKTLLVEHMEKPDNIKYVCYRALLDTWVGRISSGMRP